jgi:2,4-dienoyl-CoA reductase-like NADH-dependent reductase (Old Yellow Enzyme family)
VKRTITSAFKDLSVNRILAHHNNDLESGKRCLRTSPKPCGLLDPLPLGRTTLPNRIVFGSHVTNFGRGNLFTPRHAAYYGARAAGGAGLIITEALTVHPLDWPYEHVPFGHREEIVPSLRALAAALRAAAPGGAVRIVAQLNHSGGQTHGRLLRQSPWAPSAVPDVASKKMARAMDAGQIEQVVTGFAAAAERVARAGLDGVELNAGQYSLLRQFLSPLTNFRTDHYGGPLENRIRLLLRVVAAARRALGVEPILGVKLCGDELAPWGGLTSEDAAEIATRLSAAGGLDYLSVQIGGPFSVHITEAGMPVPQAHAAHLARTVRDAISGAGAPPVFAEGRIESGEAAEGVLARGDADACVMTRALISDPDLPRKLAHPGAEPVRPHVGMNRYFVVKGDWNRPLGDLANPRAGREARLPPLHASPAAARRRMLVIGGGPAGLEAAGTLARLGHAVRLVEAGAELGGLAARLAAAIPARAEFGPLVDYHRAMLERLGVQVELGHRVAGDEPWLAEFDRILLATGAQAPPCPWPIPEGLAPAAISAVTPRDLLEPGARERLPSPALGRALVADAELGYRMANAVEWLLGAGYGVDVLTEDFFVGRELVESAEFLWFNRVAGQGARFYPRLRVARIAADEHGHPAVIAADRFSRQERRFAPASLLVYAAPEAPADGLLEKLSARGLEAVTIGDARAPRLMGEAVLHAHRTALM